MNRASTATPLTHAPAPTKDTLWVCASAALRVLHDHVLCADELERAREVRRELATERGVHATPIVEHRHHAVVVARDGPCAGIGEALPILARLFDDERRVRETQENTVDRRQIALRLVAPEILHERELAAPVNFVERADQARVHRERVPADRDHRLKLVAIFLRQPLEHRAPRRVAAETLHREAAHVRESDALRPRAVAPHRVRSYQSVKTKCFLSSFVSSTT